MFLQACQGAMQAMIEKFYFDHVVQKMQGLFLRWLRPGCSFCHNRKCIRRVRKSSRKGLLPASPPMPASSAYPIENAPNTARSLSRSIVKSNCRYPATRKKAAWDSCTSSGRPEEYPEAEVRHRLALAGRNESHGFRLITIL